MSAAERLSRLKPGWDVPWVTSWSAEPMLGVGPCATVGGRLAIGQAERPGYGRPEYSKNHLRRQRASVAGMLCPMCGEPTAPDDRFTHVAKAVPAGVLRSRGLAHAVPAQVPDARIVVDAGAVPPLHRRCIDRSLEHCPHLRAEPNIDVRPFPAAWAVTPLLVEARPEAGPRLFLARPEAAPAAVSVISFLQICGVTEDEDVRWRRGG
jgi:hypothetical protein